MLLVMLARGPHCSRYTWFGWEGGHEMRKSRLTPQDEAHALHGEDAGNQLPLEKVEPSAGGGV